MKDLLITYGPVLFRGWLYFMIATLPVVVTGIQPYADSGVSPSVWQVIWILLSALSSGLVALRAFYDGSAQRHQDYLQNGTHENAATANKKDA